MSLVLLLPCPEDRPQQPLKKVKQEPPEPEAPESPEMVPTKKIKKKVIY